MTTALVIFGVVFGALVILGLGSVIDRAACSDAEQHTSEAVTEARYLAVLQALDGLPARMHLLASASEELSQLCRRDGLRARFPLKVAADGGEPAELPLELRAVATRPGAADHWQALDRGLQRLVAIHYEQDGRRHADAHEEVSIAARSLALELDQLTFPRDLDHCWFCARSASAVSRMLCSPYASICEECVRACHHKLTEH